MKGFEPAGLVVEVSQIVVHEADEPDVSVGLPDADSLAGKDRAEVDHSLFVADAATASATLVARALMDFVGMQILRQTFPAYQRQQDFDRIWEGFVTFLRTCAESAGTWPKALDEFEGVGQIILMTIHKSKGSGIPHHDVLRARPSDVVEPHAQ